MVKKTHKVELKLAEFGYGSTIKIDGRELHGVTAVNVKCVADEMTTVKIELFAQVEVVGKSTLLINCEELQG